MKIAVSATGPTLDAEVDPRFGRCQYLVYVDTDTMEFRAEENSNIAAGSGAGVSTAQVVANMGVDAVLTGNTGPKAFQVLEQAGVQIINGASGAVRDAVEAFKSGRFQQTSSPSVDSHFGIGGGGMGRGMGRGMGMGGGRGMGMGGGGGMGNLSRGMGMGPTPDMDSMAQYESPYQPPYPPDVGSDLNALKQQVQAMSDQLKEILRRLDELDKKQDK
ncbi:MAG: NifB/NifX family molybdenum-iron cluster-binding protein [Dehalococcoidia bacterium]